MVYEYHDGYPRVRTWPDSGEFYVHRLTAVAEYGFEHVRGKQIHHLNGHRFDGRPSNLVPLTATEHQTMEEQTHLHTE